MVESHGRWFGCPHAKGERERQARGAHRDAQGSVRDRPRAPTRGPRFTVGRGLLRHRYQGRGTPAVRFAVSSAGPAALAHHRRAGGTVLREFARHRGGRRGGDARQRGPPLRPGVGAAAGRSRAQPPGATRLQADRTGDLADAATAIGGGAREHGGAWRRPPRRASRQSILRRRCAHQCRPWRVRERAGGLFPARRLRDRGARHGHARRPRRGDHRVRLLRAGGHRL